MLKRVFDFTASLMGLIILSPLFIVISILIKLDSPGPIMYRGVRAGKNFKPFRIFKFRSMIIDSEKEGLGTPDNDPRVTKIGKWLRYYKLDELPQLLNVLKGEMSLVGPRPEVMEYAELYKGKPEEMVYSIKPGITDYASLWNVNEGEILKGAKTADKIEKKYFKQIRPEKIRLQVKYVREKSFWTDIKIIFLTIKKLIKK